MRTYTRSTTSPHTEFILINSAYERRRAPACKRRVVPFNRDAFNAREVPTYRAPQLTTI